MSESESPIRWVYELFIRDIDDADEVAREALYQVFDAWCGDRGCYVSIARLRRNGRSPYNAIAADYLARFICDEDARVRLDNY